jgi:hypothetical protein
MIYPITPRMGIATANTRSIKIIDKGNAIMSDNRLPPRTESKKMKRTTAMHIEA